MTRKLLECWRHRCLCRRERQVVTHPEFITLRRNFGDELIILSVKCRETCTGVHTRKKVKYKAPFRDKEEFLENGEQGT